MIEIEIKLAPASCADAELVFADPEIAPYLGEARRINMHTRYFDTSSGLLASNKFALRLRQEDETVICTFKAETAAAGSRVEIEAPAATLEEGIAAILSKGGLPLGAAEILSVGGFEEICSVNFVRRTALYCLPGILSFWLCYDSGRCFRGELAGEIAEIELEYVSGSLMFLESVVRDLCQKYGLDVFGISKLGQAMALDSEPKKEGRT